ncbi:MAG: phosphotransferase [Alphaproteobacteria bacterium]|nr:phosphotransferase [Alphaproteobacteria bacterium]
MSERDQAIEALLAGAGWAGAARRRLAGDASFRRYERITGPRGRAMLMDAPPPQEDVRPFLLVARHLRALGYSAPAILAEDTVRGLLLIEDFGDDTFTRRLATGADEAQLYALAVDLLIDLHRHPRATAVALPPYDEARLLAEASLLTDWYLPAVGQSLPADAREEYLSLWRQAFAVFADASPTLVLRDYHVDNLMRLDGRSGVAACGLLDFQDAVLGSPAYDLVSLLEDARRDVTPSVIAAMRARYAAAFPGLDRAQFDAAYAVLGAQRNAKIVGIFTRLMARDKKPHYLAHIPRVWCLLEGDLAHPALAALRIWFDRRIPRERRVTPPVAVPA